MKLWLKNNLSKSEECVDTESLTSKNLVCDVRVFLEVQTILS